MMAVNRDVDRVLVLESYTLESYTNLSVSAVYQLSPVVPVCESADMHL